MTFVGHVSGREFEPSQEDGVQAFGDSLPDDLAAEYTRLYAITRKEACFTPEDLDKAAEERARLDEMTDEAFSRLCRGGGEVAISYRYPGAIDTTATELPAKRGQLD